VKDTICKEKMSMKKLLLTAASINLALSLVACGPGPNDPKPSASPTATATPAPAVTPDPAKTPDPATTPAPVGTPAAIDTPAPDPSADAQVTSAMATLDRATFRYNFNIMGTGLGSLDGYQFLQVKVSSATVPLVVDGVSKVNEIQLRALEISDTKIAFNWLPDGGSVTSGDEIEVTFERKGDAKGRRSSKVRLTVN
jgi:hypothetical protein